MLPLRRPWLAARDLSRTRSSAIRRVYLQQIVSRLSDAAETHNPRVTSAPGSGVVPPQMATPRVRLLPLPRAGWSGCCVWRRRRLNRARFSDQDRVVQVFGIGGVYPPVSFAFGIVPAVHGDRFAPAAPAGVEMADGVQRHVHIRVAALRAPGTRHAADYHAHYAEAARRLALPQGSSARPSGGQV